MFDSQIVTGKACYSIQKTAEPLNDNGKSRNYCVVSIFTLFLSPLFFTFPSSLHTNCLFVAFFLSAFFSHPPYLNSKQSSRVLSATLTTVTECVGSRSLFFFCSVEMRIPHCYSPLSARLAQSDNDYILNRHVFDAVVME